MKRIPLTQGFEALVDDEDYERLLSLYPNWQVSNPRPRRGKMVRYAQRSDGRETVMMHRIIMNAPKGVQVDHINGVMFDERTVDNRQSVNLRLCTVAQNAWNSAQGRNRVSKYSTFRGVGPGRGDKWRARILVNGKKIELGAAHPSKEDAGRAYNKAAIEYYKEFAALNIIELPENCEHISQYHFMGRCINCGTFLT